jgi:type I restriction enzyme S subunit|nr:MAG TPA: Type I restriction enzyme [Caudoviricetes sp.]
MSKLDKLLRELCPDGVEHKKLVDAVSIERGKRVVRSQLSISGKYPVYQNSLTPLGYHTDYNYNANTTFIIVAGAAGEIGFSDKAFWAADDCFTVVCPENVLNRYIYHLLLNNQNQLASKVRKASIPRLSRSAIENLVIPIPPLDVQCEIVRILDNFTNLTAELTAELTARKTQYAYYRDKLLKAETNAYKYKLGEIATVTKLAGFEFTNYVTYSENGNIIALRGLNVKNGRLDLHDVKYVDKSDFSKLERSKLHIGDMLFTYVGTVGQVAIVDEEDKYYLAPNVALIRCNKEVLLPQYMKYYFQTTRFWDKQIRRLLQSSSMQNIPMEKIRKFEIAVPPLDVQNRIVNVLDNFEKICSDLNIGLPAEIEARQKQYEYYRDKLLTFKEVAAT